MNVIQVAKPKVAPPLTDHPTVEARTMRGLWFGLLIAVPFWILMAALALALL